MKVACGVCQRTDMMDSPGFLGRSDRMLGVQLCAYCGDGPDTLMRLEIGVRNGGRGKNGTLGRRRIPEMTEEEYQLWCLEWLASKLNSIANLIRRSGKTWEQLKANGEGFGGRPTFV